MNSRSELKRENRMTLILRTIGWTAGMYGVIVLLSVYLRLIFSVGTDTVGSYNLRSALLGSFLVGFWVAVLTTI